MTGFVTTRDLWVHWPLILREFGAPCLARCAWRTLTHRRVTFLECV